MLGARLRVYATDNDFSIDSALSTDLTGAQRAYLAVRRPVEVAVCLVLLLLSLPVMAILALAVVLDSPGGPLFSQQRIGRDGRLFTIYKLRSMLRETPQYMPKVDPGDPRVTRVGRFLRLSGLDELPQLFNVITGDLNLVGPRPEMAFIVERFDAWERRREVIRPGITGWWQIHHRSGEPLRDGISYDMHYLANVGLPLDAAIVIGTVWVMIKGACQSMIARSRPRPRLLMERPEES